MEIRSSIVWSVVGSGRAIASELTWTSTDPLAIHACFHELYGNLFWQFARAIVAEALAYGHSGDCDVTMQRGTYGQSPATGNPMFIEQAGGDVAWLYLSSPDGTVALATEAEPLGKFLATTFDQVPLGFESIEEDLDRTLDSLLSGELESYL
jgi:hypothetical protein